ncbi:MAG: hypothetical protein OXC53_12410 [Rhodobacteraceae bacterium]|nr:hypothetical protein [Paracoccaceae bacterium]
MKRYGPVGLGAASAGLLIRRNGGAGCRHGEMVGEAFQGGSVMGLEITKIQQR